MNSENDAREARDSRGAWCIQPVSLDALTLDVAMFASGFRCGEGARVTCAMVVVAFGVYRRRMHMRSMRASTHTLRQATAAPRTTTTVVDAPASCSVSCAEAVVETVSDGSAGEDGERSVNSIGEATGGSIGEDGSEPGMDGVGVRGGAGGGGGGGGATTSGTTAEPTVTSEVAVTLTPRLAEMAAGGWLTSALAAAEITAAVAVVVPPAVEGASGMVRMAATVTLPAATRSVR